MRMVGVSAGSGHSIVFFDLEKGELLRVMSDVDSAVLTMSVSVPLQRQKLAPVLATGHFNGRMILREMQVS